MGGGVSRFFGIERVVAAALLFGLILAFSSSVLSGTARAGTETGEFCPTCPDWTNLEGWLAQKEAYERSQMSQQKGQQSAGSPAGQNKDKAATKVEAAAKEGYVRQDLITRPKGLDGRGVILDVRSKDEYLAGHIPGARNIFWKDLLKGGSIDPGLLEEALGRAGIEDDQRIIVCGGPDEGGHSVFWALSYLGQQNLSLLDGGIVAAQEAGVALSTNAPSPEAANYTVHILPWLLVTPGNLEGILAQSDVRILDARDFSDYGQSRLGNGSICLSLDKIYDQGSRIKSAGTLKDLFDRRLDQDSTVIVYGTPQAYSLFYSLRLMGYNATLIQGDWWKETDWAVKNIN